MHFQDPPPPVRLGTAHFDRARLELRDAGGAVVPLRPQAVRVLEHLLAHAGRVVGRDELFDAVWPGVVVTDDSLVQCISDIRAALGDAGRELIRTVPRRGYRLDLPTNEVAVPDAAPAAGAAAPLDAGAAPSANARASSVGAAGRARPVVWAALLAFALLTAAALDVLRAPPSAEPSPAAALAVLPFRAEGGIDPAVGAGLAEDVVGDLARNVDLRVISPRASFPAAASGADATTLATRLGARYLIDGRVSAEPGALRVRVQLVDGRDGRIVWTDESRLTSASLAAPREALLHRIAGTLRTSLAWEQKRLALGSVPGSLDSYTATLRAIGLKHRMSPDATRQARMVLAPVLAADAQYAPAWTVAGYVDAIDAGLSLTRERSFGDLDAAVAMIERAIAMDPVQPMAWQALSVALNWTPRAADAVAAAEEALKLAPGDADNLIFHAMALGFVGRHPEALAQVRRAQPLYPLSPPYVDYAIALTLATNGLYDESLKHSQACIGKAPGFVNCRTNKVLSLAALGRTDEARAEFAAIANNPGVKLELRNSAQRDGPVWQARRRTLEQLAGATVAQSAGAVPVDGTSPRP